jgi:hypothetical protein
MSMVPFESDSGWPSDLIFWVILLTTILAVIVVFAYVL